MSGTSWPARSSCDLGSQAGGACLELDHQRHPSDTQPPRSSAWSASRSLPSRSPSSRPNWTPQHGQMSSEGEFSTQAGSSRPLPHTGQRWPSSAPIGRPCSHASYGLPLFNVAVAQSRARKSSSALAEVHVRAAVRDDVGTDPSARDDRDGGFRSPPLAGIQRARRGFMQQPPTEAAALLTLPAHNLSYLHAAAGASGHSRPGADLPRAKDSRRRPSVLATRATAASAAQGHLRRGPYSRTECRSLGRSPAIRHPERWDRPTRARQGGMGRQGSSASTCTRHGARRAQSRRR